MHCVSHRPWLMALLVAALVNGGPAATQAAGEEPATDKSRTFKRLDRLGAAELRKQLQEFPEVGLDQTQATNMYNIVFRANGGAAVLPDIGPRLFGIHATAWNRPDWLAVSWRKGPDCVMTRRNSNRCRPGYEARCAIRRAARDLTRATFGTI